MRRLLLGALLFAVGCHGRSDDAFGDAPPAIRSFTASRSLVAESSPVVLTWNVARAETIEIFSPDAPIARSSEAMGSISTPPLSGTTELTLRATGPGGVAEAKVQIAVERAPSIISFEVAPAQLPAPGDVSISWNATGASITLEANGEPVPNFPGSDSGALFISISAATRFELIARGGGAVVRETRAIAILEPETEPNDDRASAGAIPGGGARGMIGGGDRVDFYAITVPAGGNVLAELSDGLGSCSMTVFVELWTLDGDAAIAADGTSGPQGPNGERCGKIDPRMQPRARNMPAGNYYLAVRTVAESAGSYVLTVSIGEPACGNGLLETTERCDDGNELDGDGCASTCGPEPRGRIQGPETDVILAGGLVVAGQQDFYELEVLEPAAFFAELGVPVAGQCAEGTSDTVLEIRDEAYRLLGLDELATADKCSELHPDRESFTRLDPGKYWVVVRTRAPAARVPQYALHARLHAPGCGNGATESGEACDDGNRLDGDGCSSSCETEVSVVSAPGAVIDTRLAGEGSYKTISLDIIREPQTLVVSTSNGSGGCDVDTALRLKREDGSLIAHVSSGMAGSACAAFFHPRDVFATDLRRGRYTLEVVNEGTTPGRVVVEIAISDHACGNGILERASGEQCDDQNSVDGDGCSPSCFFSPLATYTAPGAPPMIFRGSIAGQAEHDLYLLQLTAPAKLLIETGAPEIGRCESGANTVIVLRDLQGLELGRNNDIASSNRCSRIDAINGTHAFAVLGPGTYELDVHSHLADAVIADYEVRIEAEEN